MKAISRLITMIFLIALTTVIGSAQKSIGVHSGITYSDMSSPGLAFDFLDNTLPHPKRLLGMKVGVFTEMSVGKDVTFQTGINYTDKGFAIRENINVDVFEFPLPIGATINARLKYIEVPLVAKYALSKGKIQPYVKAGGTLGYASSAKLETKARVIVPIHIATIPVGLNSSLYNRFEIGAMVGGGVEMPTKTGSIMLDVQYTHGLNSLINTPVVDLRAKNNGFGVSVGYKIPIGAKGYGA